MKYITAMSLGKKDIKQQSLTPFRCLIVNFELVSQVGLVFPLLILNRLLPAVNTFPLFATIMYVFSSILVTTFRVSQMLYIHGGELSPTHLVGTVSK